MQRMLRNIVKNTVYMDIPWTFCMQNGQKTPGILRRVVWITMLLFGMRTIYRVGFDSDLFHMVDWFI
ncbi:unnamed protein product [Anisakis simplex]|uniref:Bestrophin homolog n=1 Tax=Anisakis simplex TaxID=6269 RepID=A0A0M3JPM1_ANISI|nr:unnamed protein product [Anisakis simplex]